MYASQNQSTLITKWSEVSAGGKSLQDKLRQRQLLHKSINLICVAVLTASIAGKKNPIIDELMKCFLSYKTFFCERKTRAEAQMWDNQRMRLQGKTISHSVIKTTSYLLRCQTSYYSWLISFEDITFCSYRSFYRLESVEVADAVYIITIWLIVKRL